ncbi:radical SAM protein [Cloacibacillus sp. An23]|uniref:radical SAM protein n=1 Tax=Cloacibacillus sp. An23 TaxID=1965591 RepID=UPI000B3A4EFE|nr:radical SAM protein [Cloacibacillus sp. An23]OUO94661.1 radical SAM protein [Cloacibacillus sp. An23]
MEYEGQICRSPMERGSFSLPVTVGCCYNRCYFCDLFKHLRYRELPLEQVEAELRRVSGMGADPKTVFLGDGSAFNLSSERLTRILAMIHKYFPSCRSVNMDATVPSILSKTPDELRALSENGVRRLYLGIETGLDDVLTLMNKCHTQKQAYEAAEALQRAGITYDAHMMTGVAGRGRGTENAGALAEFYNKTRPGRITNFSLFIHKETPLYDMVRRGEFSPADELENLEEERALIERLEVPAAYDGIHDFVPFRLRGDLPSEKESMLRKLDAAITAQRKKPQVFAVA